MKVDNELTIQMTPCQETAYHAILEWSKDRDELFATLAGAAGTGKSWLSRKIVDNIPHKRICVSAPTHQALNVVKAMSGAEGHTIQSLLGLRPDTDIEDFDPNNVQFDRKNPPKIKFYSFILIDEASMIQKALLDMLLNEAHKSNTKILFVGDHIQLPPVNEMSSQVFNPNYVEYVWTLETPCRQSLDNPLYLLLLALRMDIEFHTPTYNALIEQLKILELYSTELEITLKKCMGEKKTYKELVTRFPTLVVGDKGYCTYKDAAQFQINLVTDAENALSNQEYNYVRALAWRNSIVGQYNAGIRNSLYETKDAIVKGDILKCYRPITQYDASTKSVYTLVNNSQELRVVSVEVIDSFYPGLRVYSTTCETLDTQEVHIIDFVHNQDYHEYLQYYSDKITIARETRRWGSFYTFFDSHVLLEDLNEKFKNKQFPRKAFDYGYSLTVHKSQGSTFKDVYVDARDIREHYRISQYYKEKESQWNEYTANMYRAITLRLLYVALSRASNFANILT